MPTSKPLRAWLAGPDGTRPDRDRRPRPLERAHPQGRRVRRRRPGDHRWPPSRWRSPTIAAESRSEWLAVWQAAEAAAQEAIEQVLSAAPVMNEPALARALGAAADADGESVLLASSMPIRDAESFMAPARRPTCAPGPTAAPTGSTASSPPPPGSPSAPARPTWAAARRPRDRLRRRRPGAGRPAARRLTAAPARRRQRRRAHLRLPAPGRPGRARALRAPVHDPGRPSTSRRWPRVFGLAYAAADRSGRSARARRAPAGQRPDPRPARARRQRRAASRDRGGRGRAGQRRARPRPISRPAGATARRA